MIYLDTIAQKEGFYVDFKSSLKDSMKLMQQNRDGAVVLLKDAHPVGFLTESDIILALENRINLSDDAYKFASTNLITANKNRPIEFAFDFLTQHDVKRIILVDDYGEFAGIVLQEDLFEHLESDVYKVDLRISNIIKTSQKLKTLSYKVSINEALKIMRKYHIGSVLVSLEDDVMGILTERDILKLTYKEVDLSEPIVDYVTSPLITIGDDSLVIDAIDMMSQKKIRRIIIHDTDHTIVAILTKRDILKYIKGNYTRVLQLKVRHAQEIMDLLPEAIIEIFDNHHDRTQVIYWINKEAKNIFGDNLIDKDLTHIFKKQDWEEIYEYFNDSNILSKYIVQIGTLVYEVSGTLSKNINNSYIKLILKDVTEYEKNRYQLQTEINTQLQKQLEHEHLMMQQSKLATMGEMIGHIAHQWRQPLSQLSGIFMNLDASYEFDELTPKYVEKKIKKGNELLKYMSHTIEDFRNFFQPNRVKEVFNLNQYIQNAINLIRATLTYHHVKLEFDSYDEYIPILGYPSEFSQVILNILNNSTDALVENKIKNPKITIKVIQLNEKRVSIQIKDNAGGINESVIDKIFDMYVTTKSKKDGTGLGLYISKIIIQKKLMGEIFAKNEKNSAIVTINLKLNK